MEKKRVLQIGEEIETTCDLESNTLIGKRPIKVKKGTKAVVTSAGSCQYLNGESKGMIMRMSDIELKGYDNEHISRLIFKRLDLEYGIKEFLEENEIEEKDFIDSIWDVLSDILL